MGRKTVEMKMILMKKRIPNSEGEDGGRQTAVVLVTGKRQQMVGMLVVVGMELCPMGTVAIQPRKKLTCQFSQNDANQKRYTRGLIYVEI